VTFDLCTKWKEIAHSAHTPSNSVCFRLHQFPLECTLIEIILVQRISLASQRSFQSLGDNLLPPFQYFIFLFLFLFSLFCLAAYYLLTWTSNIPNWNDEFYETQMSFSLRGKICQGNFNEWRHKNLIIFPILSCKNHHSTYLLHCHKDVNPTTPHPFSAWHHVWMFPNILYLNVQ
jgi:hypothetical protein